MNSWNLRLTCTFCGRRHRPNPNFVSVNIMHIWLTSLHQQSKSCRAQRVPINNTASNHRTASRWWYDEHVRVNTLYGCWWCTGTTITTLYEEDHGLGSSCMRGSCRVRQLQASVTTSFDTYIHSGWRRRKKRRSVVAPFYLADLVCRAARIQLTLWTWSPWSAAACCGCCCGGTLQSSNLWPGTWLDDVRTTFSERREFTQRSAAIKFAGQSAPYCPGTAKYWPAGVVNSSSLINGLDQAACRQNARFAVAGIRRCISIIHWVCDSYGWWK